MNFSQDAIEEIILLLKNLDFTLYELKKIMMSVSAERFTELHNDTPINDSKWDIFMNRYRENRENFMKIERQIHRVEAIRFDRGIHAVRALNEPLSIIDAYVFVFKNFHFDTVKMNKAADWILLESPSQTDLDLFYELLLILVEYINNNA